MLRKEQIGSISKPSSSRKQQSSFRVNVIVKDDDSLRISIVVHPHTTIAKLKRTIEHELHQLHGTTLLVSLLEDSQGFVLSNNSIIGDHLHPHDTLYVQCHRDKNGTNMNLPSNLPDLFLTLRYVSSSVVHRLLESIEANLSTSALNNPMNGIQVVPEIVHLGFWYSNYEVVHNFCKLLNKIFTSSVALEQYYGQVHEMQSTLLIKVVHFWMVEVRESFAAFPQVMEELLDFLEKVSGSARFSQMIKLQHTQIVKIIMGLSKDSMEPSVKKKSLQIIRNFTGKGGKNSNNPNSHNSKSAYLPTALTDSAIQLSFTNVEDLANAISSGSSQQKLQSLQSLCQYPKLMTELTVRFDYYWKISSGLFSLRNVKDKTTARVFSEVLKNLTKNTSRSKAGEVMQKDIMRKIHNFLLQSHPDAHQTVFEYYALIAKESAKGGVYNVQQASQLLRSPYSSFQQITADALAQMSSGKASSVRFLPAIKDCIKAALKTEDPIIYTSLMKTISNLTLDQQCRYQIVNLKGIQVLVKFLQIGQSKANGQLQRTCAKGLLNLSISSRQNKARVLGSIQNILERYYKGRLDGIAASYIEGVLKAPKT